MSAAIHRRASLVLTLALALSAVMAALMPSAASALAAPTTLNVDAAVSAVSCPMVGECSAVGTYEAQGGEPLGMLLTQLGGVWVSSTAAKLPGGAASYPNVSFASISCPTAGNCTAVGNYVDDHYDQQGLMFNQRSGGWRAGVRTSLPAGAAGNPQVALQSISCATPGNCTAVGSYVNAAGDTSALLVSQKDWSWDSGQTVPLPAGASAAPSSALDSVSCRRAGDCTAVGWYTDQSGAIQGLLLTQAGGSLRASEAALPAGAAGEPNVSLSSVSCASPGDCTAVGDYTDSSGNQLGLLLTQSSGGWGAGAQPQLPANALATQSTTLNSVTCTGSGYCTAVGEYVDDTKSVQGLLLTQSGGGWTPGTEAVLPANANGNQDTSLYSVSCWAYETCVVAGTYFASHPVALLLSETTGRWKLPVVGALPPGAAANPYTALTAVSCSPTGGYCLAAGEYQDNAANGQGVLIEGDGLYWREGLLAPLPGGLVSAISRRARTRANRRHPAEKRGKKIAKTATRPHKTR